MTDKILFVGRQAQLMILDPKGAVHGRGDALIPGLSRRLFVGRACALAANSAIAVVSHWARAEQPESPRRIGVLLAGLSPGSKEAQQLRDGLQDAGYSEGRDLVIEWRTAGGDFARLPKLAAELVQRKVEVIVATGTVAAQAAKRATSTIPIVITVVADPVGSGLVTSFAHPGGNVTGVSNMAAELSVKRLQLLKEAIPRLARVAVLWNPDTPSHTSALKDLKAAATPWAIELNLVSARNP